MWRSRSPRFFVLFVSLVTGLALVNKPALAAPETTISETSRVSVASDDGTQGNGHSASPTVTADGRLIVFSSFADNLVASDTNDTSDIFVHDRATATTTRIAEAASGPSDIVGSGGPSISADGGLVVYHIVSPGDANFVMDVFLHDVAVDLATRITVAPDGSEGNQESLWPEISSDGSTVVYFSRADNLVADDANGVEDVFLYDVATATTTRISVAGDGTESSGESLWPAVSGDGTTIVYTSYASNLVPGDTNDHADVFLYDVATKTTTRVSVASDGTESNGGSASAAISADGSTVVYSSSADNLVPDDANDHTDVFLYDVATKTTTRVSVASDGTESRGNSGGPAVSADGTRVVFWSGADGLVPDDTNDFIDIFLHNLELGTTARISVASDGTQPSSSSHEPAISADGRTVAYESWASNLVAGDTGGIRDVFVTTIEDDPFDDDDGSIFEDDIEWLATEGITSGCGPRLYCPSEPVTRGQMAAFLVRALDLPTTTTDYFTDDTHSIFHHDINALAHTGITTGCTPTTYCPADPVTRGQMAAFLRRALE